MMFRLLLLGIVCGCLAAVSTLRADEPKKPSPKEEMEYTGEAYIPISINPSLIPKGAYLGLGYDGKNYPLVFANKKDELAMAEAASAAIKGGSRTLQVTLVGKMDERPLPVGTTKVPVILVLKLKTVKAK